VPASEDSISTRQGVGRIPTPSVRVKVNSASWVISATSSLGSVSEKNRTLTRIVSAMDDETGTVSSQGRGFEVVEVEPGCSVNACRLVGNANHGVAAVSGPGPTPHDNLHVPAQLIQESNEPLQRETV
jgi:hypothetical protein